WRPIPADGRVPQRLRHVLPIHLQYQSPSTAPTTATAWCWKAVASPASPGRLYPRHIWKKGGWTPDLGTGPVCSGSVRAPARSRLAALALALGAGTAILAKAEGPDGGTPKRSCWGWRGGCEVSGALRVAPRIEPTPELQKLFGGKVFAAFSIDLDSDGRPDFIVQHSRKKAGTFQTCFVDADWKARSCWRSSDADGFGFLWFAQLDPDPMLELFEMVGDEDYSDYRLQKLDPKSWARKDVLTVAPLIRTDPKDPRKTFWGYPWDVRGLVLQEKEGRVRLLVGDPETLCGDDG